MRSIVMAGFRKFEEEWPVDIPHCVFLPSWLELMYLHERISTLICAVRSEWLICYRYVKCEYYYLLYINY